jgi:endoglucanase
VRTESLEFLRRLQEAPSPSGYEQPAQAVVREYAGEFADDVRTDVMGNVVAAKNETGRPRVMLAGHVDEIGLMATYIDDDGFISVRGIGGWDTTVLIGQYVTVHTASGPVPGIVGRKPVHLLSPDERGKALQMDDLFVDLGVAGKDAVAKLVRVGDPITVGRPFQELGPGMAAARCFDDKAGTWVVVEALRLVSRRRPGAAVFAVSTTQEEVGLRGAMTSAYGLDPDVGIAVDVTFADDAAGDTKRRNSDIALGKGPTICRGANINPRVFDILVETAEAKKIPYQLEAAPGATGTDAGVMQVARAGVATGVIGVPLRYMHTPVELLALSDLENAAKLIAEFILRLDKKTSFIP